MAAVAAARLLAAPVQSQLPQEPRTALPGWHPVKSNVLFILCDDLGYGDVHVLNPQHGKIATPNIDRLATEGMTFSDAHSTSAVCSPSRYSILTGRYNWRSRLQTGVLDGDSPALIAPERMTVASMLKHVGYATACIGKWHLGMNYGPRHYNGRILDGPLQHGFDHFFGVTASLDMPPFAFVEDDYFPEIPTVQETLGRQGLAAPGFDAVKCLPTLVRHAGDYFHQHAADSQTGKPFFLYLTFTSPHTPLVPTPQFQGKSGIGPYGDFVMETDWALGEVLKSLDSAGLAGNTLVFFTSDNGCAPYIGATLQKYQGAVKELEALGHFPSAQFRGYKSDIWEGGHRVPCLVRWPGKVAGHSTSDQTICLVDLMATLAQITGSSYPANAGEDSFSILPILLGKQNGPLRYAEVHHSIFGDFAIRQGQWKLELCAGSGGWDQPDEKAARDKKLPDIQLYDMKTDEAEQHNVEAAHPDVVQRLTRLLEISVADGRTTPGPIEPNDKPIDVWKLPSREKVTTHPVEGTD